MVPLSVPQHQFDLRQFEALLSVADFVSLRSEPGAFLSRAVPKLCELISFDFVNLALPNFFEKTMKMFLWENGPQESLDMPVDQTAVGWVWQTQTVLSIDDLHNYERDLAGLRRLRKNGIQSYCVLPLISGGEKLGALGFGSKQTHAFAALEIEFLQRATELSALAVNGQIDAVAFAQECSRLRMLIELTNPALKELPADRSIQSILRILRAWAPRDFFGVYIFDGESQCLRLHTVKEHLTGPLPQDGMAPLDSTLSGQVFRTQQGVILDEPALSVLPFPSVKQWMHLGVKAVYLAPLVFQGNAMGVFKVSRREQRPFTSFDRETLERVTAKIVPILAGIMNPSFLAPGRPSTSTISGPGAELETPLASADLANLFSFASPGALARSAQLLAAYFNASEVGLCILDSHFAYVAVNDALAGINGIPAADHIGKTVRELLGDFAELIEPQFERVLITGEPVLNLEISSMIPTRSEPGHWREHYVPLRDETGKVTQIGVAVVEITEKRRLEESLRDISETLQQEKQRQHVMSEITRILAEKDVQAAFPQISARLRRLLHQEYAALAVREQDTGKLVRLALDFPLRKGPEGEPELPILKDRQGRPVLERAPLILSSEQMRTFSAPTANQFVAEGMKSLCLVPLLRPTRSLGVLTLGSTRLDAFKTDDLLLLNQVAAQLAISIENASTAAEIQRLRERLEQEKAYLDKEVRTHVEFDEIVGQSAALKRVLADVAVVAASDATVLILGETGTGKGLVARAIHRLSRRKDRSFITLNCAAIPTGLLESELFGHEKGAFTGAVSQKVGRLELADKGTLFLDEIGEIPLELQPKLLRVLQDREFERLGGTRTIRVNLRLIAATNRDLAKSVAEQDFRRDLFYRLNVFPVRIPALKERAEDIPFLVRYFVHKYAVQMNRKIETIPAPVMEALTHCPWPGNVRELENFIERCVILTDGSALYAPCDELPRTQDDFNQAGTLQDTEREHIIRVLRETGGMLSGPRGAARRLALKRSTLQSKMKRLGITRQDYS